MITKLAALLRELRRREGEILKDMADRLGASPAALSAAENCHRPFPSEWREAIAAEYGLTGMERAELGAAIAGGAAATVEPPTEKTAYEKELDALKASWRQGEN